MPSLYLRHYLIDSPSQLVYTIRGECVIAISPRATMIARFITEELIPLYQLVRAYYERSVHTIFLAQVRLDHTVLLPQWTDAQRLDIGFDHYWDYICDRCIRARGFSVELYSELVWVPRQKVLYLPSFEIHSSGPHPVSRGYSIRGHIYVPPEAAGVAANGRGLVFDLRGDRQLAPISRYLPAGSSDRMDMYVSAV